MNTRTIPTLFLATCLALSVTACELEEPADAGQETQSTEAGQESQPAGLVGSDSAPDPAAEEETTSEDSGEAAPPAEEEAAPAPAEPAQQEKETSVYYGSCADAREAGAAPLSKDDPGYRRALDRDHDGIACDK